MTKVDDITNIVTKRGFFFPTAEIYNAKAGFWTYGHLGVLMRNKFENLWLKHFLSLNDNYWQIDGNYILPSKVFEASGHLQNFKDPLTECKKCHFRFRADELIEDETKEKVEGLEEKELTKIIKKHKLKCPKCKGELDDVKFFNMMFELKLGATGQELAYLAPETAQNPFISFKREFEALRRKLPMGLAMIGRAFRNEISPRQGFFRLREFNQAELQIFFDPSEINKHEDWEKIKNYKLIVSLNDKKEKEISAEELNKNKIPKFYVYHLVKIQEFYLEKLKIPKEKFRFRELSEKERAFYNKLHFDIEINMDTLNGFREVAGLHYRTDHDLKGHEKVSKESFEVQIDDKKIMPHVLELSFGIDRNLWALIDVFYKKEKERDLFLFPFSICPVEAAEQKEPCKIEITIDNKKDLNIRIVKSSSASVKIPQLKMSLDSGPDSDGYVSNIEGLLDRFKKILESERDTAEEDDVRKHAKNLLKKLWKVSLGEFPLKIIIEDETGNSAIISDKAKVTKLKVK